MRGRGFEPTAMPDVDSEALHAAPRRSKALRSGILGSLGVRGVALLAPLLLIPVNLDYLGMTLFGLWAALSAVAAVTTFSDLGMGNGLLTLLPKSLARNEVADARALVSSAYALLIGVSAGVLALLVLTFPFIPWEGAFDPDSSIDPTDVRLVVAVALGLTAVSAPLGLSIRLYYATQRAHLAAIWTSAVILSPLVPVLVAVRLGVDPLYVVIILLASGPVTQVFATAWFFARVAKDLRPHPRLASRALIRRLFDLGSLFLVLSITLVLATSLDNLVLTHSVGLAAVAAFAIPAKVFAQFSQALMLINLPLWAANGDAMARGDVHWVRRTTLRMVMLSSGAAAAGGVVAFLLGPSILRVWLGQDLELSSYVLAGLALTTVATASLSPLFMLQNAAGVILPQILGWGAFAVVTLPGKYLATHLWGFEVLPWVTLAGLIALVTPFCLTATRRILRSLGQEAAA